MKAYIAHDRYHYDNEGARTIVFAENASKAKQIALCTEACEDAEYIDIRVNRYPKADKLYRGRSEVDWYDKNDRIFLVKECGWACAWIEEYYCADCPAKQWCRNFEEEDEEMENQNE